MEKFEKLFEITNSSKEVFKGKILHLFEDKITLPNGHTTTREVIRHIGAVGIVALTDDNKVIIEKQFRYPLNDVIAEIPAGKLDSKAEDPLDAAKRELKEETGYSAKTWINIGTYCPAAAYCDEIITLYIAKDLEKGEQKLDDDEFLNIEFYPFDEILKEVIEGKIPDGKTQVAILKAKYFIDNM